MPFTSYSTLAKTLDTFQIGFRLEKFVVPAPLAVSAYLHEEIEFVRNWVGIPTNEFGLCENLIYPMLKEVWKHYPQFKIWGHTALNFDDDLSGTPDHFLARRSPLGTPIVKEPYLLVVEAKQDDFDWGWGQCLAAMLTAQKLNRWPEQLMYGIATTGTSWQFGKLQAGCFTRESKTFDWDPLEEACSAINFMFEQCRLQLAAYAGAA
jgi:hypothetical protein